MVDMLALYAVDKPCLLKKFIVDLEQSRDFSTGVQPLLEHVLNAKEKVATFAATFRDSKFLDLSGAFWRLSSQELS